MFVVLAFNSGIIHVFVFHPAVLERNEYLHKTQPLPAGSANSWQQHGLLSTKPRPLSWASSWMDRERTPPLSSALTLSFKQRGHNSGDHWLTDWEDTWTQSDGAETPGCCLITPLLSYIRNVVKCDYLYPQRDLKSQNQQLKQSKHGYQCTHVEWYI